MKRSVVIICPMSMVRRGVVGALAAVAAIGLTVLTPGVAAARPAGLWLEAAGENGQGSKLCLDVKLPDKIPIVSTCFGGSTTQTWIIDNGVLGPKNRRLRNEATGLCIGNSAVATFPEPAYSRELVSCDQGITWWRQRFDRDPGDDWVYFSNVEYADELYFIAPISDQVGPYGPVPAKDVGGVLTPDEVPLWAGWRPLDLYRPPTGGGVPKPGSPGSCGIRACQDDE
jgi:hypothetical protein